MTNYPRWRDALATANDPAFLPIEHIDHLLKTGMARCLASETSAIVVGITHYPGGAIACRTIAAAGDMEDLIAVAKPTIEAWAKAQGCTHSMIEGRDGWRRMHPDYRHHQTVILKDL